jgi:phosphoesterase RecJ-like protein
MRFFLEALGKTDITCALQDRIPRMYAWMPGASEIGGTDTIEKPYDLVVVLDVAQLERIGRIAEALDPAQKYVVIDHHPEDKPFAKTNFVDRTFASCAEIVLELFDAAGLQPTLDAATVIYVGLTTDTGSFRFGNTNARAHRNAARLLSIGVNAADIAMRVFDVMSEPKLELVRRMLARIERGDCGRFAWSHLYERDLEQAGASAEDTDGLINFIRNIDGVQVAALFRELSPGKVKVSLRTRPPVDAGAVLKPLGGGGHTGAAGLILQATLHDSMAKVNTRIAQALGPSAELARRKAGSA